MAVSTNINVDYIPTGGNMVEQNYQGASSGWVGSFDLWTNGTLLQAGCLNEPEGGYCYTTSGMVTSTKFTGWVANGVASGTQVELLNITDLNSKYRYSRTEIEEKVGATTNTRVFTERNLSYTIPTGVDSITITLIYLPKVVDLYVPNSTNNSVEPQKIYVSVERESKKAVKVYVGNHANRAIRVFEE